MISASPVRNLLCVLALFLIPTATGSAQQGTREAMADAMSRMMEAMGMFDSAPSGQGRGGSPMDPMSLTDPLGQSGWGSPLGMPWGSPLQDPSRAFAMRELMKQFSRQMTPPGGRHGDTARPWEPSRLEGIWEGRTGELLIVQGGRFRIYSPQMQPVDGLIQIRGDRLALYNPLDGHAQPFEFAESQGRLVLRDLADQVYLYRRLRLDGGNSETAAWSRSPQQ